MGDCNERGQEKKKKGGLTYKKYNVPGPLVPGLTKLRYIVPCYEDETEPKLDDEEDLEEEAKLEKLRLAQECANIQAMIKSLEECMQARKAAAAQELAAAEGPCVIQADSEKPPGNCGNMPQCCHNQPKTNCAGNSPSTQDIGNVPDFCDAGATDKYTDNLINGNLFCQSTKQQPYNSSCDCDPPPPADSPEDCACGSPQNDRQDCDCGQSQPNQNQPCVCAQNVPTEAGGGMDEQRPQEECQNPTCPQCANVDISYTGPCNGIPSTPSAGYNMNSMNQGGKGYCDGGGPPSRGCSMNNVNQGAPDYSGPTSGGYSSNNMNQSAGPPNTYNVNNMNQGLQSPKCGAPNAGYSMNNSRPQNASCNTKNLNQRIGGNTAQTCHQNNYGR